MKVLGIAGSLRRDSYNAALLGAVGEVLPDGVDLAVWDRLAEVPPFDEDAEHVTPPAVADLKAAIAAADAVVFSTPEYNASIPGQLKNALDWVSRPFADNPMRGKPALVVGTSTGMFGAVWAQAELRKVLEYLGARVIDEELPVGQAYAVFEDGRLTDDDLRDALCERCELLLGAGSSRPVAA